jgi:hypothetical protein
VTNVAAVLMEEWETLSGGNWPVPISVLRQICIARSIAFPGFELLFVKLFVLYYHVYVLYCNLHSCPHPRFLCVSWVWRKRGNIGKCKLCESFIFLQLSFHISILYCPSNFGDFMSAYTVY